MGSKWNDRSGHQQLRAPVHGNCQAEGGGSQLGTAVDRGLSKAKGTGGGRELPLPLVPMARAPTQLAQGRDTKGTWVQHSTGQKGLQLAQQTPRQAPSETLQEMLVREGSSPSRHHKEPGVRLKLSRLRL